MKKILALAIHFLWRASTFSQTIIPLEDVGKNIGGSVTVCGKISGGRFL